MFIWDFILGDVMDQIIDWIYGQVAGFLGDFFAQMGNMGVELFPIVPMELFELSVHLQSSLAVGITGYGKSFGEVADSTPSPARSCCCL